MNRDVVLQSCFNAEACLSLEWTREEQYLQLQLAGFIDLFRKAVSEETIQGQSVKIDNAKLVKASATITELSECDSPFKEISPNAWKGLKALRPAVDSYLDPANF